MEQRLEPFDTRHVLVMKELRPLNAVQLLDRSTELVIPKLCLLNLAAFEISPFVPLCLFRRHLPPESLCIQLRYCFNLLARGEETAKGDTVCASKKGERERERERDGEA